MNHSEAACEFYERLPHPGPTAGLQEHHDAETDRKYRRSEFHLFWPTEPFRDNLEILVLGRGTSEAARYAVRHPAARITAIDVIDGSSRHAGAPQAQYGLSNLEAHRLTTERVRELGRSFDLVVCTGVIHHPPEPDAGLRALRDVLNPGGAMRLMVYARYGCVGIHMMQAYCRILGIGPSVTDLRALRETLAGLAPEHPISSVLRKATDFCRSDAMAAALFHPLDRAYTVPEIYDWLERCGMSFGRWSEQAPYLARCGQVATGLHGEPLARLSPRQEHAAVELLRGNMVSHSVIAYRADRGRCPQPIEFASDRWRTYVPLALQHTVCVREGLPPGSAAMLINRAHRFTDIICPVEPFEDRLLQGVDGKQTLGQIVRLVGGDEGRAKAFFERLWQYDQIVFDASRAD